MRPLSASELRVMRIFANQLSGDTRDQFLADLEYCRVEPQTQDESRLEFVIPGYDRPPYTGQHAFATEGVVTDADGESLSVCIYADQFDRLLELELIRWGSGSVVKPNWDSFRVAY